MRSEYSANLALQRTPANVGSTFMRRVSTLQQKPSLLARILSALGM